MATNETKQKIEKEIAELREKFNKKHENKDSPWVIIHGGVYDMTQFQLDHPGGPDVIQDIAGQDATQEFEDILHTAKARKMGHAYLIGSVQDAEFDTWIEKMTKESTPDPPPNKIPIEMILAAIFAIIVGYYYYMYTL